MELDIVEMDPAFRSLTAYRGPEALFQTHRHIPLGYMGKSRI